MFAGYITAYDLYFGLIKAGPENMADNATAKTAIIIRCHFHFRISLMIKVLLKKLFMFSSI